MSFFVRLKNSIEINPIQFFSSHPILQMLIYLMMGLGFPCFARAEVHSIYPIVAVHEGDTAVDLCFLTGGDASRVGVNVQGITPELPGGFVSVEGHVIERDFASNCPFYFHVNFEKAFPAQSALKIEAWTVGQDGLASSPTQVIFDSLASPPLFAAEPIVVFVSNVDGTKHLVAKLG